MEIKTKFNVGDYAWAIGSVGLKWVVEKEKFRVDFMKIYYYSEKDYEINYFNMKNKKFFLCFSTREEAQQMCDRLNKKFRCNT